MWRTAKSSGNSNICQIRSTKWGEKNERKIHWHSVYRKKKQDLCYASKKSCTIT